MKPITCSALALAALTLTSSGVTLDTARYPYHCDVTFAGYSGTEALENFPALVRIPKGSDVYLGSADGSDLRFTDAEGNLVPHEINTWRLGGESLVWVRVPRLEGQATKLTLYFGAANDDQRLDAGEVWSAAAYQGVWHFEGSNADSSANHLACEDKSWPTSQPKPSYTSPGSLGTCMKVANDGYLHVPLDSRWTAFPTNTLSVSWWLQISSSCYSDVRFISTKMKYSEAAGFEIHRSGKNNGEINTISSGSGNSQASAETPDFAAAPVYFTATFADGKTTLFANGTNLFDHVATSKLVTPIYALKLAANADGGSRMSGTLDEVRLRWADPSAAWAAADYATQADPNFAVLGPVQRLAETKLDPADFSLKSTITFSGYTGDETLFGFPALVRFPASCGLAAAAAGNGLRFADADGYLIPHEVETLSTDGESLVWVRVPKLRGTATTVTVYSGAKASAPAALPADSVWSGANYRGVWHMNGSGADSSANHLPMTTWVPVSYTPGKVGTAYDTYRSDGALETTNAACWAAFPSNAVTVSGWIKTASMGTARIFSCKKAYSDRDGFEFTMQFATNRLNAIGHDANQHTLTLKDGLNFKDDFVYATAVYKDGYSHVYANGVLQDVSANPNYFISQPSVSLKLGRGWAGQLDELRFQWAAQSADWVKADYDTQNPDGAFAVLGEVEACSVTTLDPSVYRRRATVTFSGYAGASTLANFPALVRISAGSPIYNTAAADGHDLRFTDTNDRLVPHEIELWDKSGESLVWVRVPELSGRETALRLYFKPDRDAVVPAAPSFRDLWGDAGYKGVWHLAGSAADSSPNALEGVAHDVTFATFGPLGQAFQSSAGGAASGGYISVAETNWWAGFDGVITVSAWVHNTISGNAAYDRIVSTKCQDSVTPGFEVTRQGLSNKVNANGNRGAGNYQHVVTIDPHDLCAETLYATFVFAKGYYDILINGERVGSPMTVKADLLAPTNGLCIGVGANTRNQRWHGQIDEVRLRWAVSSDDWIKADYDTQKPGSDFTTISPVERLKEVGAYVIVR